VLLEIGECNVRSQKAMAKMGETVVKRTLLSDPGKPVVPYLVYKITPHSWRACEEE
jgi:hypothetical protein